ncbi:hypothetical protein HW115_02475 [Verrucomicrobiaceae bacterium N1E253]|uniref:Uncharacterized protein n=1 Tax=Oceaniferula marina TaxID=2748318 RepID=A0A851GBB4_9BACT|nr:hypothetical protein [Oceaniferula marina]NWK54459.1 hypothetical protein [Oceaniferula marina]
MESITLIENEALFLLTFSGAFCNTCQQHGYQRAAGDLKQQIDQIRNILPSGKGT